ncbi:MAG TPA: hypothetical protein VM869_32855 [Enhygromyxa sp.]|nr:hypothetical protein [Enhygromyxa sp.]
MDERIFARLHDGALPYSANDLERLLGGDDVWSNALGRVRRRDQPHRGTTADLAPIVDEYQFLLAKK